LEFQPEKLAVQNDYLFATTKGAPRIHFLDVKSGKELKEAALPGSPIQELACHPATGQLYASNLEYEIYSIDPRSGQHKLTGGKGKFLAVDPTDSQVVYSGIQKPIQDFILVQETPGNVVKISLAKSNLYGAMMKYKANGDNLECVAVNDNAAVNGFAMNVSADGKRIAMAGGGGWSPKGDPRRNYCIAVFETDKMTQLHGQISTGAYPQNIGFHPALKYAVAYRNNELILVRDKSYVTKTTFTIKNVDRDASILFGGYGSNVVYVGWPGPRDQKKASVEIFPLPLSDDERQSLLKDVKK
jgi:hypothetical protein